MKLCSLNQNSKFIILSLNLWAPVYVPVARNHEEMAVSPKVNFLFLQFFSFVGDLPLFRGGRVRHLDNNFFKLKNYSFACNSEY